MPQGGKERDGHGGGLNESEIERKDRFIKANMPSDIWMICCQIEISIGTIRGTIAKKYTRLRPVLHFMAIVRIRKGIA